MNRTLSFSFILGIVGALIDFSTGYLLLSESTMTTNDMGVTLTSYNTFAIAWGIGISVLGIALVLTAVANIFSMEHVALFGVLMVLFGIIMLFIAGAMYSHVTPIMSGYLVSSIAMSVVGALMISNGIFMWLNKTISRQMSDML